MTKTIRKVVDTNQLRDLALRRYLARSKQNFAVLPDYTAMEAYKGKTLTNIFESMEILADFPKQVIVLKGTRKICGLSGRQAGLQRRMIDTRQTTEFPTFCGDLKIARAGNDRLQSRLLEHSKEATKYLDETLIVDAAGLLRRMETVSCATYSPDELKILRKPIQQLNLTIAKKILVSVFALAGGVFEDHPARERWPKDLERFRNTFQFRFALCAYLLMLEWISTGSVTATNPKKVRNDMIDVGVAAYATFFDGLLSKDGKARHIYDHAMAILTTVLASPMPPVTNDWLAAVRNFARRTAETERA